jgi:hypothetical protein
MLCFGRGLTHVGVIIAKAVQGRFEVALGIDQEIGTCHDFITGFQALQYLPVSICLKTQFHGTWLEMSIAST